MHKLSSDEDVYSPFAMETFELTSDNINVKNSNEIKRNIKRLHFKLKIFSIMAASVERWKCAQRTLLWILSL